MGKKHRQKDTPDSNKAKGANKNSKSTVKKNPRPSISTMPTTPFVWQPPPPRPIEENPLLWSSGIDEHGEGDWQLAIDEHGEGDWQLAIDCVYGTDDDLPRNGMTLPSNDAKRIR